ncbi:hypothetical protein [Sphingosinicella microcystinivorans]|uniref:Uncharacterized protein n=1 Tax=Sphingosinicella microcystinivorans TaxID=335406 RepID=A0AAD1D4P6_SPHMI|nr:hypothetical protein [Sphingosinicella microcystinivorans]RKS85010.1 hypothetical protein DFR51_3610 [Sphingosinicella microcystinivorans]BBE33332.1 hypothetical protein SmB9_09900 [Sphingosinicella microcystinivorans]
MLRALIFFAALCFSAAEANAAARELPWAQWIKQNRFVGFCQETRQFGPGSLVGAMISYEETLDQAYARQSKLIAKAAQRQRNCLQGYKTDRESAKARGTLAFPPQEADDLYRAIVNSVTDLEYYLLLSKEEIKKSPVSYFESTSGVGMVDAWLAGDIANLKKYDQYLRPVNEVCGTFDFPAQPKVMDAELGRRLLQRRSCYITYLIMPYPMENLSDELVRQRMGELTREGISAGGFQGSPDYLPWRCAGKKGTLAECFSKAGVDVSTSNGRSTGSEVSYLATGKKKLNVFLPYACSRSATPGCIPASKFAVLVDAVTGANGEFIQKWEARLSREKATAKAEIARIDEYAFLWRYGKTREEYMREQQSGQKN